MTFSGHTGYGLLFFLSQPDSGLNHGAGQFPLPGQGSTTAPDSPLSRTQGLTTAPDSPLSRAQGSTTAPDSSLSRIQGLTTAPYRPLSLRERAGGDDDG